MQYPQGLNPKHRDLLDSLAAAERSLATDGSSLNYAFNTGRLKQAIKSFLFVHNIGITFEQIKQYCEEFVPQNEKEETT